MEEKQIDAIVGKVIEQIAPGTPTDRLRPDRPFRDQFLFDSIDFLTFVLKLEKETDSKISELDYPKLASLQGCRDFFINRQPAKVSASRQKET